MCCSVRSTVCTSPSARLLFRRFHFLFLCIRAVQRLLMRVCVCVFSFFAFSSSLLPSVHISFILFVHFETSLPYVNYDSCRAIKRCQDSCISLARMTCRCRMALAPHSAHTILMTFWKSYFNENRLRFMNRNNFDVVCNVKLTHAY